MNAHRARAAGITEDIDTIEGISVHGGEQGAGIVGADGDETEMEGAAQVADLREGRAVRVVVLGAVVVDVGGERGHGAVAGVAAEPDFLAAAADAPAGPEGVAAVEEGARAGVLAGEAADARGDGVGRVGGRGGGRGIGYLGFLLRA